MTYLLLRLSCKNGWLQLMPRNGARADGCNSADLIRSFRQKFKLNVQLLLLLAWWYAAYGWSAVRARRALTCFCVRACVYLELVILLNVQRRAS